MVNNHNLSTFLGDLSVESSLDAINSNYDDKDFNCLDYFTANTHYSLLPSMGRMYIAIPLMSGLATCPALDTGMLVNVT